MPPTASGSTAGFAGTGRSRRGCFPRAGGRRRQCPKSPFRHQPLAHFRQFAPQSGSSRVAALLLLAWLISVAPGLWSLVVGLALAMPALVPLLDRAARHVEGSALGWAGASDEFARALVSFRCCPHQAGCRGRDRTGDLPAADQPSQSARVADGGADGNARAESRTRRCVNCCCCRAVPLVLIAARASAASGCSHPARRILLDPGAGADRLAGRRRCASSRARIRTEEDDAVSAANRSPHLAILRRPGRPGDPLAAARQHAVGVARRSGAADLADEHRPLAWFPRWRPSISGN